MSTRHRLLYVDDEPRILSFVSRGLVAEGYEVHTVSSGDEGLRQALGGGFDLVILDLLMPDLDGRDLLRALSTHRPDQPVLVLSCVTDAETKVDCLELGAVDYLDKPFSFEELLARVRLRLREHEGHPSREVHRAISTGGGRLTLDLVRRVADSGHGSVALTEREFLVLRELMSHAGEVVSKQRLLSSVWGYNFEPGSNLVEVCVWRLRDKLGRRVIRTARGKGYMVDAG